MKSDQKVDLVALGAMMAKRELIVLLFKMAAGHVNARQCVKFECLGIYESLLRSV